MIKYLFLLLIFAIILSVGQSQDNPHSPVVYKIDLDLPPSERFKVVVTDKLLEIKAFANAILTLFPVPQYVFDAIGFYEKLMYHRHREIYEELKGVSKYSGFSFGQVFVFNFMYEIFASCTSIVTVDQNGIIIHGRNLDYMLQPYFSNMSIHYEFYKKGSLVFEGDGFAAYLGIITGLRKGAFGISIDQRTQGNTLTAIYEIMIRGVFPIPYYIRKVLETAEDFTTAVDRLSSEEFGSPGYLIVSGMNKNEGVVITRDASGVSNLSQINVDSADEWFLVQTNYDRDVPDPAEDYRRVPAEKRMRAIGRENMNSSSLYNGVLILSPNKRNLTISSAILSPRTGEFNTTIWY